MPTVEWESDKELIEWGDDKQIASLPQRMTREEMFDKAYWNGGAKVGGYAFDQHGGSFADFPCHWHTVNHILARRPESVLELGAARGYVGKKLQDQGVHWAGLEISRHCHMTRCCDPITVHDLCETPWPVLPFTWPVLPRSKGVIQFPQYDLCFSIAVLEHVPEKYLPFVIREMSRTCQRGLHGIDFGENDDGFDKTHVTLRPREFWLQEFAHHAPGWSVEILDKEELERGVVPQEVLFGDGKIKLEVGSFTNMMPFGWLNIDVHDLAAYAQPRNCQYLRHDVRNGLPQQTGTVSCIHANHFLEHLSYKEGLSFLRECRRVLNPQTGALRLAVPDAALLCGLYDDPANSPWVEKEVNSLGAFAEISDGVEAAPTEASKLWELLFSGHQSCYDAVTLLHQLSEAGFEGRVSSLHSVAKDFKDHAGLRQIIRETNDTHPCLSLVMDAIPKVG